MSFTRLRLVAMLLLLTFVGASAANAHVSSGWSTQSSHAPTSPMFTRSNRWIKPLVQIGGLDVNVITADPAGREQHETFVWANDSTIVVHYNDESGINSRTNVSYSTDGGATFTRILPSPFETGHGFAGRDPTIIYNAHLGLWFAASIAGGCATSGISGTGLWTSPDGINWTAGVCAHIGGTDDRMSHWVDNNPASPYYGRQYISFQDYTRNAALFVTYSDDGVQWSNAQLISPGNVVEINAQTTGSPGADGTVFIAAQGDGLRNLFYRSTDGGVTWSEVVATPFFSPPGVGTCTYRGIPPAWRNFGFGQPGVGPNGVVHYVYNPHGAGSDLADIAYIRSTDNGITWSQTILLNTDAPVGTREQWMPSLAVTAQGRVVASWYDRRNTTDYSYEYWSRISLDNGATWLPDAPVSDVIIPLPRAGPGCNQGDYNYHFAYGEVAYLTWTDGRIFNGDQSQQDVFFDKVSFAVSTPSPTSTPIPTLTSTVTSIPSSTSTSTPTQPQPSTPSSSPTSTTAATLGATHSPIPTSTPPPTATPCLISFSDVPSNHTFHASIRCLACRGVVTGYADGTFRADNLVTRAQLAKIVSNAGGFSESPGEQIFQDVPTDHPFYDWINRLTRRGYMSGYTCGSPGEPCVNNRPYFRPFNNATRAQTSKIVSNAARYNDPPQGQTFEDVPPTHPFYVEIQRIASRGIIGGYNCGGPGEPCMNNRPYFRPYNDVTRGQSAKIVANTFFPNCLTP